MSVRALAHHRRDGWLVGAACLHATLLVVCLRAAGQGTVAHLAGVMALGFAINWTSNTVSHIHLHTPLFVSSSANRAFSLGLSLLVSIPQSWWKRRHLIHHGLHEELAATERSLLRSAALELLLVVAGWFTLAVVAPFAGMAMALPALLLGLGLCAVQGYEEHARASDGVDTRVAFYNRFWFNDGFHAAHHRRPTAHWTTLPAEGREEDVRSELPPIVRWAERAPALINRASAAFVDALERASLSFPWLLRAVLVRHARAWGVLLADLDVSSLGRIQIVGGGLFPRTALILRELLPDANLEIVEIEPRHAAMAEEALRRWPRRLSGGRGEISFVVGAFQSLASRGPAPDLLVVPLAFRGERRAFYTAPPARFVVVHDWMWRRPPVPSALVSWWLLKRLALVQR